MEWQVVSHDADGKEEVYTCYNVNWATKKRKELDRQNITSTVWECDHKGNRIKEMKNYDSANMALVLLLFGFGIICAAISLKTFLGFAIVTVIFLVIRWAVRVIHKSH